MILHIFSDAPYTKKFIEFINKDFDKSEHNFIVLCINDKSKYLEFYNSQDNCIITKDKNIYFNYKEDFINASKIIIHQLNKPVMMLSILLFAPKLFQKMIWIIWGGDVYFYKYKSNSIKDNLLEYLRKITIPKIPVIASYIKGDYDKVVEVYKTDARYIKAKYPSPINIKDIKNKVIVKKDILDNPIIIIVGNSADPSNEHINTYNLLAKFKDENIKVISILSYGGTKSYIDEVIDVGRSIFKENFEAVIDYMDFKSYLSFLNNSDICLFNHKRQQGLGNQIVFFALHKKVFISDSTTPFRYYKDLGIDIYSAESIQNINFNEFIYQSESNKDMNRKLILEDRSDSVIKKEWKEVFR